MKTGLNPVSNPNLSKKESTTGPLIYVMTGGQPVWSPRDYASFAREGYMQNPIVYRCIRVIVDAAMSIPMLVYKDDQPVDKHAFYDLINAPNPFEGTAEFLDRLYSFLLIAGNSYVEAVSIGRQIRELYTLRPDRMKITLNPMGRPLKYTYTVNQSTVDFMVPEGMKQRPILHIKQFHPTDDLYGLSSMEPAAFSIDVHSAAGKFNKALLDNQARPSGVLVVVPDKEGDASLTQEQFDRIKSELDNNYTGQANAGRPMLLEGGLDWKEMGTTPQDMEFVQGKNSSAREIALSYGVPPQILGIPGDNTYSNLKEANVALYRQTVLPFMVRICQAMSVWLRPTFGDDFRVWFDINEIAGLSQEREDTWNRINAATNLTVNEKREALGYDEVEGGDDVLIQSSLIPLTMEEEPEVDVDPITGEPGSSEVQDGEDEDGDNPPPTTEETEEDDA